MSAMLSAHDQVHVLNDSFLYLAAAEGLLALESPAWRRAVARVSWHARDVLRRVGPVHKALLRARNALTGGWRPSWPDTGLLPGPESMVGPRERTAIRDRLLVRYRMFHPDERGGSFLRVFEAALVDPGPDRCVRLGLFLDALFTALVPAEDRECTALGEKTPRHCYCAPWMLRLRPSAKIIALVRHPLSNVASLHERMGRDLEAALAKYCSFHEGERAQLYDPHRSLVVRYEDLLKEPAVPLQRCLDYLGLEGNLQGDIGSSSRGHYVGKTLDPERDRRRREYFSERDRQRILERCVDILARYYPEGV